MSGRVLTLRRTAAVLASAQRREATLLNNVFWGDTEQTTDALAITKQAQSSETFREVPLCPDVALASESRNIHRQSRVSAKIDVLGPSGRRCRPNEQSLERKLCSFFLSTTIATRQIHLQT